MGSWRLQIQFRKGLWVAEHFYSSNKLFFSDSIHTSVWKVFSASILGAEGHSSCQSSLFCFHLENTSTQNTERLRLAKIYDFFYNSLNLLCLVAYIYIFFLFRDHSSFNIKRYLQQVIMTPEKLLDEDIVEIIAGQWTEEVALVARNTTQWGVKHLCLYHNGRAKILKDIGHISFPVLTSLILHGNEITSIDGLPRVDMLQLNYLGLNENKITSVRVLRKASWRMLRTLFLGNVGFNYLHDVKRLTEGCFPQLEELYLCFGGEDTGTLAEQGFPAKMEAISLDYLCIQKDKHSFARSVTRVLQQRWPYIAIE